MPPKKKPEKQDDEEPGKKKPMKKKGRASTKGRSQTRWCHDLDEFLLLAFESNVKRHNVKISWDEIAKDLGPKATGGAIEQHLAKLRLNRYKEEKVCPPPLPRSSKLKSKGPPPIIGFHPSCKDKGKDSQEDRVEEQIDKESEGSDPGYEPTTPRKRKAKAKSQSSGRKTKRPRACAPKIVSASTKACVDAPFLQFSPKSEGNSAKQTSDECSEDESSATKSNLSSIPEDALENWEEWKIPKPKRDNSEDIPEERSVQAPSRRLRIVANRSRADSQMRSSTFQTPYDPASSSALQGSPSLPRGTRGFDGFQGTAGALSYGNEGRQSSGHFPSSRDYRYENPYVNRNPNENTMPLWETADPMFHGLPVAPRQRVAEEVNFNVSDPFGQDPYPAPGYDDQGFFASEMMMGSMHDLNDGSLEPGFDPADTSYLQNAPNWMAGQGVPHSPINDWYQNNEAASLSLGYLPQPDNIEEELSDNGFPKPRAENADRNSS